MQKLSIRSSILLWACKGIIISVLDVIIAYMIWRFCYKPDFYFRGGADEKLILMLFNLFWWIPFFLVLFGLLHFYRLYTSNFSILRFFTFIILSSLVIALFHIYEFRIQRLVRYGICSSIIALLIVLLEFIGKLSKVQNSALSDATGASKDLAADESKKGI